MSLRRRVRLILMAMPIGIGCSGSNTTTENDAAADSPTGCTSNAQCSAPTAVCDVGAKTCVECLAGQADACTGMKPTCGDDQTCRGCEAHAECTSSDVCLPDGACAVEDDVAYVAMGGTGTACTKGAPCGTLAAALATMKPTIKIAAGLVKAASATTIDGRPVTIVAEPGAKLDRDGDGPILEVRSNGADVTIYDLEITGQTGPSDSAISVVPNGGAPKLTLTRVKIDTNQGGGISSSGGTLTVTQSTLSGNQGGGISSSGGTLTVTQSTLSGNAGGGISVGGTGATFVITNNFIFRNGDPDTGTYGGVNLAVTTAGINRFEFNTVVDNRAAAGATRSGGMICDIVNFTAPNNIVARNSVGGSTTVANAQTLGTCTYPSSKTQSDVAGLNFAAPENAPFSYKLTAGSSAVDFATTSSTIDVDHEGDPRPQGPAKDCGADELRL